MDKDYRILIIEDEKKDIDILVNALEPFYGLIVSSTGEKGIRLLEHNDIDLMLLSTVLSDACDHNIFKVVRTHNSYKDLPIVMISEHNDIEIKKKGFELGAVDYITKPFDVEDVKARIYAHLMHNINKKSIIEENAELHFEVDKKGVLLDNAYNKLEYAHIETIEKLSRAAEYRDDDTGMHVKRVGKISSMIASKLGLSTDVTKAIEHAAPLHDVGKIGIPDRILLKPDKLSREEWAIMKTHCVIGKQILDNSSSEIIRMAEIIAYTHHERWDGSGYPLGLKGESIPVVSRIVAIADVCDALMSKRAYKEAYSFDVALQLILEEEGKHFAPDVVKAFLSSLDEIEMILRLI